MSFPTLFSFLKTVLLILGILFYHDNFIISLSISAIKPNLTGIALTLQISLGSSAIVIVSLPTHECGMSFSLYRPPFSQQCHVVSRTLTPVKLISKYFFYAIANGIIFQI